ncbi:hypothetical protein AaE_006532 [Aphanomyces astaci]|uniref:RING-type E3 ubiquitin transferase BRCA1 n=1 Tax=Aphanomyces astaci TaxID=112090 RepID=A0A6A4ZZY1_APHAT|nr:hypothetical protein AaE_006532 [Aphanomyces astaci]
MEETTTTMTVGVTKALTSFSMQLRCPICLESVTVPYSLPCNHCFCEPCIGMALTYAPKCPVCKASAKKRHLRLDESVQRIQNALQVLLARASVQGRDEDKVTTTTALRDPDAASDNPRAANPRVQRVRVASTKLSTAPIVNPLRLQRTPIRGDLPRYKSPTNHLRRRLSQKENVPTTADENIPHNTNPVSPPHHKNSDEMTTLKKHFPLVEPTKDMNPSSTTVDVCFSRTYSDSIVPCTQESYPSIVDLTSSVHTTPPQKHRSHDHVNDASSSSVQGIAAASLQSKLAVFKPGDVVQVMARTWPGINKLGGTAWISTCNPDDNTYSVRYVLGGREHNVHAQYISIFQDLAQEATPVRGGTKRRASSPLLHTPSSPFSSPTRQHDDETRDNAPRHYRTASNPSRKKQPKPSTSFPDAHAPPRVSADEPMVLLCSGLTHDEKLAVEECAVHVLDATIVHDWTPQVTHIIVQCQHLSASKLKLRMPPSPSVHAVPVASSSKHVKRWVKIRSLKFLKALVSGRWIVGPAWIKECLQQRTHVDEQAYEVHGLMKAHNLLDVARKARKLRETHLARRGMESAASVGTGLFSKLIFYVHGQFASPLPPKAEISALVRLGGGKVSTSWTDVEGMAAKDPSLPIVIVMEHASDASSFVHPAASSVSPSSMACVGYEWVLDCISECTVKSFECK